MTRTQPPGVLGAAIQLEALFAPAPAMRRRIDFADLRRGRVGADVVRLRAPRAKAADRLTLATCAGLPVGRRDQDAASRFARSLDGTRVLAHVRT